MSAIHTLKSVFNGGELSPMLDARVDSEKYASGCRELTNFIPSVYGGIKKRPGTELLGFAKNNGPTRLHSFKRSTDTNYVLEFGDKYVRFWKGGESPVRVFIDGNNDVPVWAGSGTKVKWVSGRSYSAHVVISRNDALYICKSSHTASSSNEPGSGASWGTYWRTFTVNRTYQFYSYIDTAYVYGDIIPWGSELYMWTYAMGSYVGSVPEPVGSGGLFWKNVTNYVFEPWSYWVFSEGDQVARYDVTYHCIQSHTVDSTTTPGEGDNWPLYWQEVRPYTLGDMVKTGGNFYTCLASHNPSKNFSTDASLWSELAQSEGPGLLGYEVGTPYLGSEVLDLQFTQLNDVLFIAHPNHPPKRLSHRGELDWIFDDVPFQYAPSLDVNEDRTSVQIQFDEVEPFILPWATSTNYDLGDRVFGPGAAAERFFICKSPHGSGAATSATRPGLGGSWEVYWNEITPSGYEVGDRVTAVDVSGANKYNGEIFTCHTAYQPGAEANDEPGHGSAWQNFWNLGTGSQRIVGWANNTSYQQGSKVRRGKAIYECIRSHTSALPTTSGSGGRTGQITKPGNCPGLSTGWTRYWRISAADSDLSGLKFALYSTEPIFTEEDVGTVWLLELGTGGVYEDLAIPAGSGGTATTENNPLFIQGGYTVTTVWNDGDAMQGTLTIEESLNGVTWSVVRQFTQTSDKEGNILYNGEAPPTGAWYRMSVLTASPSTSTKIKMEAHSSVYKLPFKITAFVEDEERPGTKVRGNLIMPGDQMPPVAAIGVATSVFRKPAFSAKAGFPRTVAFHDSRLWWGGTRTHPTRMWASHTEDYYIYLGGSLDTDGLDLTLATVEANAIQWMASFNRSLVIGTSGDEWTVDSGDTDESLTPTNLRARRRTRYGSNGLPPQLTGDALLWLRRGGGRLHEFAYVYERDSFSAPDLTLLAEHILRQGEVKQTAFVSCPDPILWMVNGSYLAGLSYNREHNVTAWHKHVIEGGSFESVAAMYGDHGVDELWFVVKRGTEYSLERLHPQTLAYYHGGRVEGDFDSEKEACFLDGACIGKAEYDEETNQTIFSGFKHLHEMQGGSTAGLIALWEGQVLTGSSSLSWNSEGEVVFPGNQSDKKLIIGKSYVKAAMQSMNLEVMLQEGTSQGRNWRLIRVIPNVWRSRSFDIISSGSENREVTLTTESTEILDELHFSGSFQKQLNWGVKSENPYPCNLLGAVLKFEVTGG